MNNPTVILNGDQVYCDELIRENARLTIQHEVDRQKMEALERQIEDQAANIASLEAHSYAREDLEELADLRRTVDKAIKDLHFVMAGGDPCKVCAKVCMMGEGNCQPPVDRRAQLVARATAAVIRKMRLFLFSCRARICLTASISVNFFWSCCMKTSLLPSSGR